VKVIYSCKTARNPVSTILWIYFVKLDNQVGLTYLELGEYFRYLELWKPKIFIRNLLLKTFHIVVVHKHSLFHCVSELSPQNKQWVNAYHIQVMDKIMETVVKKKNISLLTL